MSIDCPRTPAAVKMAARDCADCVSSVPNENYGNRPRSRLESDHEPPPMGPTPAQSNYVAVPASRGCRWLLIFLVTDRSRSHGHAS